MKGLLLTIPILAIQRAPMDPMTIFYRGFLCPHQVRIGTIRRIPRMKFLMPMATLQFGPIKVSTIVIKGRFRASKSIVHVPCRFLRRIQVITTMGLIASFVFMFVRRIVSHFPIGIVRCNAFLFRFHGGLASDFPFNVTMPLIYLFPRVFTTLTIGTFLGRSTVVIGIIVMIHPC